LVGIGDWPVLRARGTCINTFAASAAGKACSVAASSRLRRPAAPAASASVRDLRHAGERVLPPAPLGRRLWPASPA
jgi:hypothetical protein